MVAKAAKSIVADENAAEPEIKIPGTSDREKLIEELRAERDTNQQAAAEAAQEAEAAAWLENKRAEEAAGETKS